ncbi:MAG: ABC transporter substrate-binding protein [Bifidobacteriaceae bacterium]|jgi:multiple sugar transport system substrate-binding protein|nr:ABC transporter substrate-binding protein [Bifidobacteriaceae bacterium]
MEYTSVMTIIMSRNRRQRSFARPIAASAAVLALLAVSACSTNDTPSDGGDDAKVTVRFTYLWTGTEGEAVEEVIAAFNASQDKITVVGTSNPDQQAQVLSMQSSNPQFDISGTGNSQIAPWAGSAAIKSLTPLIEADGYDTADFLPAAIQNNTVDGELYALPIASNTYQMLYNKDVLAEAGISDPPATFEDWANVIRQTSVVQDGEITRLGVQPVIDYALLAMAYGGAWYDASGNPTPDNPRNIEALQWWMDNVVTPYGYDDLQTFQSGLGEWGTPEYPFYAGDFTTMFDGNWQSAFIARLRPDLNWGVAPFPYPADRPEAKGVSRLDLSNLFIPSNSAHPEEAWEFMKFYLSNDQMRGFTLALANLPGRTSLLDDPAYAELPNFSGFLEAVKSPLVEPSYSMPFSAEYSTDMGAAFGEIVAGNTDPATAMAELAEKAKSYSR